MDQRFEALESKIDQRIEAVSQRFEALDAKVEQLRSEMDRRFMLLQWAIGLIYPFLLAIMGELFLMK